MVRRKRHRRRGIFHFILFYFKKEKRNIWSNPVLTLTTPPFPSQIVDNLWITRLFLWITFI